jgi:hypothetical protein
VVLTETGKGCGCEEKILTQRLLIDIARKKKRTLYVAFIDHQKAYDNVNRYKLIQYLDHGGCGTQFLLALQNSMTSKGMIGEASFTTSQGVKLAGNCTQPNLST